MSTVTDLASGCAPLEGLALQGDLHGVGSTYGKDRDGRRARAGDLWRWLAHRKAWHWIGRRSRVAQRPLLMANYAILNPMSTNVKIEVDERTADVLQARAAELGVTVSELVAELATR